VLETDEFLLVYLYPPCKPLSWVTGIWLSGFSTIAFFWHRLQRSLFHCTLAFLSPSTEAFSLSFHAHLKFLVILQRPIANLLQDFWANRIKNNFVFIYFRTQFRNISLVSEACITLLSKWIWWSTICIKPLRRRSIFVEYF